MKYGERYKTPQERMSVFKDFCARNLCTTCPMRCEYDGEATCNTFLFLELDVPEVSPKPCPICGSACFVNTHSEGHEVQCSARRCYVGKSFEYVDEAIECHNKLCEAVDEYKESEVK